MSIETWAKKVVKAVLVVPGERAPMDAVLGDHLQEYEELVRVTRLKIPAFVRGLNAAGLTLASGAPYDAATLRAQISRARARRAQELDQGAGERTRRTISQNPVRESDTIVQENVPRPLQNKNGGASTIGQAETLLERLNSSRPRRIEDLYDENGYS